MNDKIDFLKLLDFIDPAALSYTEWVQVGMALKEEGLTAQDWDTWSQRDPSRYKRNECFKKWASFTNTSSGIVTGGTLVKMAKDFGYKFGPEDKALDWDSTISEEYQIIDENWVEAEEIKMPTDEEWDPVSEIKKYIDTLFEPDDYVGFVTKTYDYEGDLKPTKGTYSRTAGQIMEELNSCNGDIGAVLGDYKKEAGAWIRFNPLDGKGVKNDNVTDYRYALVESDELELSKQVAILKELEIPIACMVYSGGRSVHGIVKIDARDFNEYRERVDYLYKVCEKNGFIVDKQNRNPSRLSRLPGVERKGKKQFLIATDVGKASWSEWFEWIEGINDNLPEPESLAEVFNDLPELAPVLIENVLRQGHKMLIAGPSKAGKSFALIQLCIAIAEGIKWLDWTCTQGKVLYVNLELDRASCLHRFKDVYKALGIDPLGIENIDIWNLRGKSVPMDKLAPKLIRRAAKKGYMAVVIDPIYKVLTGDENSADQMAHFTNQFDKIATELGCSVIYCHHHSKGYQGGKRSMDRASGSGVFARDPDALLDLTELDLPEDLKKGSRTAWRMEGTLREFERFKPVDFYFDYPIHQLDQGELADLKPETEKPYWQKGAESNVKNKEDRKEKRMKDLEDAYNACNVDGTGVTTTDLADYMEITPRTLRNRVTEHGYFKNIAPAGVEAKYFLDDSEENNNIKDEN